MQRNVLIKNEKEIQIMRGLGKILSSMFVELGKMIRPGIDVWELEKKFIEMCDESDVIPSCKNYSEGGLPPFPSGLCVSINNQSVHCFPKKGVILKEGDILNIDTVISFEGLHVDSARCYAVGKISEENEKLLETTEKAMYNAISKIKNNAKIGALSSAMQKTAEKEGFNVLKDYAGHGIGYSMHEYPEIPCYGNRNEGPKLREGMTVCVEALVCEGDDIVFNTSDWETEMADRGNFCIFEHTVLVTRNGYEILT